MVVFPTRRPEVVEEYSIVKERLLSLVVEIENLNDVRISQRGNRRCFRNEAFTLLAPTIAASRGQVGRKESLRATILPATGRHAL